MFINNCSLIQIITDIFVVNGVIKGRPHTITSLPSSAQRETRTFPQCAGGRDVAAAVSVVPFAAV